MDKSFVFFGFVLSWCYRAQPVALLKNCCDAVSPSAQQEKKIDAKERA